MKHTVPLSQGDLIRQARGARSRAEFAQELGVDRSGVWRYEREKLGVPTRVLNHCLGLIAQSGPAVYTSPVHKALEHVRMAAEALRSVETMKASRKRDTRSRRPRRGQRPKTVSRHRD